MKRKIQELVDKRAKLVTEARSLVDKAEAECKEGKRDAASFTAEEEQRWDALWKDADETKAEIDRLQKDLDQRSRLESAESELEQRRREPPRPDAGAAGARGGRPGELRDERSLSPYERRMARLRRRRPQLHRALERLESDDYEDAFWGELFEGRSAHPDHVRELREAQEELRALSIGTGSEGGFTVPVDTEMRLVMALDEENAIRDLATVIPIAHDRNIPVIDDNADLGDADVVDENAAYNEADIVFGQKSLGAYKFTRSIRVPEELLQDNVVGLEQQLPMMLGRRLGRHEEDMFISGGGGGDPIGLLIQMLTGKTTAAAGVWTSDEIIDMFHSVRRPYRRRGTWVCNDAFTLGTRKLKDSENQYLWQPGLQAGSPDTLMGRPIRISDSMPTIAASQPIALFGDWSFVWIGDRMGRTIKRSDHRYIEQGQVWFAIVERTDIVLTVQEAVKEFVSAA